MNRSESRYFNTALRMDEALIALLLEKNFEFITVKDICIRSGVNRSTFYLHYENMSDLLDETVLMINRRFKDSITADSVDIDGAPKDELFFMTDKYLLPWLYFVKENRRIYKAVHTRQDVFGVEHAYRGFFDGLFSPILSRYGVPKERHAYIMEFYRHGITAIVMRWGENECAESPKAIVDIIRQCVVYGT